MFRLRGLIFIVACLALLVMGSHQARAGDIPSFDLFAVPVKAQQAPAPDFQMFAPPAKPAFQATAKQTLSGPHWELRRFCRNGQCFNQWVLVQAPSG